MVLHNGNLAVLVKFDIIPIQQLAFYFFHLHNIPGFTLAGGDVFNNSRRPQPANASSTGFCMQQITKDALFS
jgi:hypothetical protein